MAAGARVMVPTAVVGRALNLSESDSLDLAGKWKHGWIPLDAVAAAVKAKRYGAGGSVKGKGRAGSAVEGLRRPSLGRTKRTPPAGGPGAARFGEHAGWYHTGVSHAAHFESMHDHVRQNYGPAAHRAYSAGFASVNPRASDVRKVTPETSKHFGEVAKKGAAIRGQLPAGGRTFSDAGDATLSDRRAVLSTGGRKASKATPVGSKLEHDELQYVVPRQHEQAARAAVRAKAPELRKRAEAGDKIAQAELSRRAESRAAKGKAATERVQVAAQDRTPPAAERPGGQG